MNEFSGFFFCCCFYVLEPNFVKGIYSVKETFDNVARTVAGFMEGQVTNLKRPIYQQILTLLGYLFFFSL